MNPLSQQTLEISPHPALLFGAGTIARLPEQLRLFGKTQAFVVTDPGIVRAGVADQALNALDAEGISHNLFAGVEPNPTTDNVYAGSEALRAAGDVAVVAVGGGSALDAAKAIALHAANGGDVTQLDYRSPLPQAAPPIIAVPSTAGTGAETNAFGVITNPLLQRKFYVGHASARPRAAVLDPALTLGLPAHTTAATGMDVLTHALESLVSVQVNPYAEGVALQVIAMVRSYLPRAVADGSDLEARAQMLLAAHIAGLGFGTTGLGIAHAVGHALGGRLNLPHGLALAVLLPHVLRFNLPHCTQQYAQAAFAMGVGDTALPAEANAEALVDAVQQLSRSIGTDRSLSSAGCRQEHFPALIDDALADGVLSNTPRFPTADHVRDILLAAL